MAQDITKFEKQARSFLAFLHPGDDSVFQILVIKPEKPFSSHWVGTGSGAIVGFFQDKSEATRKIVAIDRDEVNPAGIYVTVNPVPSDYLSRANSRFKARIAAMKAEEVSCYRNLPIDIDPVRPSGINSTDEEHEAARSLAKKIEDKLTKEGFPEPYRGSSGNGALLIFKLPDLSNNEDNRDLLRDIYRALSARFGTERLNIDQSMDDANQSIRVPGTLNRKGDSTRDRPRRYARALSIPEDPKPVPPELLEALACDAPEQKENKDRRSNNSPCVPRAGTLDVAAYLKHYGFGPSGVRNHGCSKLFILNCCVFDETHLGRDACIGQATSGVLFYKCFHDSCRRRTWKEAREAISGEDSLDQFMVSNVEEKRERENREEKKAEQGAAQNIALVSFSDILAMPKDTTPPVIERVLCPRQSLMITGPTGIGKSVMVLEAILALGTARPFLGEFEIKKPHRILVLQSENDHRTLRDRLSKMTHDWTGKRQNALSNLFTPWQNGSPQISGAIAGRFGEPKEFLGTLRGFIEDKEPDILFLDPLISYHGGDENDNTVMRKALDLLTGLMNEYDLTAFLTHHHGKMKQEGPHNARGASAITDWASVVLTLTWKGGQKSGRRDRPRHYIRAEWTKVRSFAPPDPMILELVKGATFRRVDKNKVGPSTRDVAHLIEEAEGGQIIGRDIVIEAIREAFGITRDPAREALKDALNEGLVTQYPDPEDQRWRIYRARPEGGDGES